MFTVTGFTGLLLQLQFGLRNPGPWYQVANEAPEQNSILPSFYKLADTTAPKPFAPNYLVRRISLIIYIAGNCLTSHGVNNISKEFGGWVTMYLCQNHTRWFVVPNSHNRAKVLRKLRLVCSNYQYNLFDRVCGYDET